MVHRDPIAVGGFLGYNMAMATRSTQLLDLIAGRSRPVKAAQARTAPPVALSALLRASLCKRAQYLGEASKTRQHRYAQSINNADIQRRQAAAAAAARQNESRRGMTGDAAYDSLPDVRARRLQQNTAQMRENYYRSRKDLVQQKDQATIKKEVGPVKSWGDTAVGRAIGDGFVNSPMVRAVDWAGKGLGYVFSAPKGTSWKDWSKQYDQISAQGRGDLGKDIANNLQMFGNSAVQGAATVGRAVNHYARPSTWKSDSASRAAAWSRKNEWANADARYSEKMDQLQGKFIDRSLSDPNSAFGKVNRFAMEQTGKLLGETAALGVVGGAAGGVGRGVHAGTKVMAGAVRGAQTARTGAQAAGFAGKMGNIGSKALQGARNIAAKGIETAGDTIAMPFDAAGALAHPVKTVRSAGPGVARYANQTFVQPTKNIYSMIRHPMQTAQSVGAHPFRSFGNAATGTGKWAWNAAKPFMGDKAFKGYAAYGATKSLYNGDPAGAVGEVGDMAAMGALGPAYMAYIAGRSIYQGMQQPQEGGYY